MCEECEVGMWEEEQICPICRRSSRYGKRHEYCHGDMEGLTCLWAYEGIARKIIGEAKYKYFFDELKTLVKFDDRVEFFEFRKFLEEKPVVVPVPLHLKRFNERGFNQAEVIAKLVASSWKLEVRNLLSRTKDTKQQVGREKEERLNAMEGAFATSPQPLPKILERGILLVDDVWTTGATMSECAKVLKKGGFSKVWGFVLAR